MTMQHGNRIRQDGGEQMLRELQAAEAIRMPDRGPTEAEVRRHARGIYLSRRGAPGNAVLDWLEAEIELRARKDRTRPG